jgi:hypothetical protein
MTFKTRPTTYKICLAPSRRAKCRRCRNKVEKGAARIVASAFVCPGRYTRLVWCIGCLDGALAASMLAVYHDANRVPADERLDSELLSELRASITVRGRAYQAARVAQPPVGHTIASTGAVTPRQRGHPVGDV